MKYVLHVKVIEAINIPVQKNISLYVRLNVLTEKETYCSSSKAPSWNSEDFSFEFPSKKDINLKIALLNGHKNGDDTEIGNFTLPLSNLQSDEKYDKWVELKAKNQISAGRLHLTLKITENQINDLDEILKMLDDKIEVEIPNFNSNELKLDKIDSKSTEISTLTAEVTNLKKQLLNKDKEISELKDQLANKDKEFAATLASKLSELNDQHKLEIIKIEKEKNQSRETKIKSKKVEIIDRKTIHDFEKIEEISFGGSGKVYKVAKKVFYALKVMKSDITMDEFKNFLNEYEILCFLEHPNIVKAFGIFMSDETHPPSILLEYCPTNLANFMKNKNLSNVEIVFYVYQIVEGMRYVHFRKVIHRDLKPSNILIAVDEKTIKIGDFGISKLMNAEEQSMTGGIGTQKFMAPEIIDENDDYDEKVDVYSFGVLLFFMLSSGELPKIKMSDKMKGKKAEIPNSFTQFSMKLISSCWNFNSKDRPSFEQILKDLELNNYDLVKLNASEIIEVRQLINEHKEKIPNYT